MAKKRNCITWCYKIGLNLIQRLGSGYDEGRKSVEDDHEEIILASYLYFCRYYGGNRLSEGSEKRLSSEIRGFHPSKGHG